MNTLFRYVLKVIIGSLLVIFFMGTSGAPAPASSKGGPAMVRLHGHMPAAAIKGAQWKGRVPANKEISVTVVLPLRNQEELQFLLERLQDPLDPMYGQYLSTQEFIDRFAPAQADYDSVAGYIQTAGLTVTGTHDNRILLNISGPADAIERVFNLHLQSYESQEGREFYAPDNDPEVPGSIASRIDGIAGLDNAAVWHNHSRRIPVSDWSQAVPYQIGTGPGGGMTPGDIAIAYNLNGVTANGAGQTLGLFELDGYDPADIAAYASYFKLPAIPLQNVLVDGFSGKPGSGAAEVTLDIELQMALAPGASSIIVYEGPNTNTGVLDTYNRIALDNRARQISTSWGLSEGQSSPSVLSAENSIFQQMAAQGQSIYAAAGDSGAYDNGSTLSVDDPASQPYMVGVGGTQIAVNSDGTYNHETTWNYNGTVSGGAGGGGISTKWPIPSWQQGAISGTSGGSLTMRNVPDVSLNSNPYTGYAIYYKNGWWIYGGTSCASPLWAAFTARVNQQRAANAMQPLGFANPALYVAQGSGLNLHDVMDGSTNLYYRAVAGYDNATGLGSFNGAYLLSDLAAAVPSAALSISSGPASSPGKNSAVISWTTNLASTTVVNYGLSPASLAQSVSNAVPGTSHSAALSGLKRRTTYYFQAASASGTLTATSPVLSFRTR